MKNLSFKVSLGGIIAALSVVFMFMTALLPIFVYVIPALCGAMLLVIAVEISSSWAYLTYAVVSFLSLLFVPDKEAALLYVLLMGFYPILKLKLDRIKPAVFSFLVKLIVYNVLIVAYYNLTIRIISSSTLQDDMGDFGRYGVYIFWGLTNIVFVIYDVAIKHIMTLYLEWIRKKILTFSVKKGDGKNGK